MRVLVSGSSGFIGKAFVNQLLSHGIEVAVLVRSNSLVDKTINKYFIYEHSFLECQNSVSSWNPDVFCHFAWRGVNSKVRNDEENNRYNYHLTIDSVKLAANAGCKQWIGAGSQAEYGLFNQPIKENCSTDPVSEYGKTKLILFHETSNLCNQYNLKHTWARIFSVYGPTDHSSTFISYLIDSMLSGEDLKLSSCTQKWDYLYIQDAAKAIFSLLGHSGVFNIASGRAVELKYVVSVLKKLAGYQGKIQWGYHEDAPIVYLHGNIEKIQEEIGWRPIVSLEMGLKQTLNYYSKS